ncbi:Flp pilus assembly protein CpaB [Pokkaliibacter sp. MBI-7]|uniref:Flp pilus assembly protein CpaB n=1 Tax=Pokkaliibacter sp. MBI-7 TaxID=3040600 RepID=UPI00244731F1|nr:Flp pilus assembly protein CpaB [Pokkaliibacter sp. MBI-7]MDH2433046.1 Flp pilus assembly protein CpaB [Pokkaliibacter sp. MBI-7]
MQGRTLTLIAALLFALALALGFYSLTLGDKKAPPPQIQAPTLTIWRFSDDVPAGSLLQLDMLNEQQVDEREVDDVADAKAVLGRVLATAVKEGQRLQNSLLAAERPMLDGLEPGFRAVAIKVDEVTAVGGHVQAGDRVDVLFYLRANKESGEITSARRLFTGLTVLAYGDQVASPRDGSPGEKSRQTRERSAVLAVPQASVAELLLAASSGELQLAVIGPREQHSGSSELTEPPVTLARFGSGEAGQPASAVQPMPVAAPVPAAVPVVKTKVSSQPAGLEVLLGEEKVMLRP